MKQVILFSIIVLVKLNAVELTVMGGRNIQTWSDDATLGEVGVGEHAGFLVGMGITPPENTFQLGAEAGFQLNHSRLISYYKIDVDTSRYMPVHFSYIDLVMPVFVKTNLSVSKKVGLSLAAGPAMIHHTFQSYASVPKFETHDQWSSYKNVYLHGDHLGTDWGAYGKFELVLQPAPKLVIKPAFMTEFDLTGDNPLTESRDRFIEYFISLGLALKL